MKLQANSLKIINTFTAQQFNSAVRAQLIFFMQAINMRPSRRGGVGGGLSGGQR